MVEIRFLALVHLKRSFHDALLDRLGLTAEQAVYLDEYGHVQSVDQVLALEEASRRGKLGAGDLVVLAAAGTGYTWSSAAVRWGPARAEAPDRAGTFRDKAENFAVTSRDPA